MKPHKWAKEIKAWADGAEIEISISGQNDWSLIQDDHDWSGDLWEYRIKPQPKEPQYLYVYEDEIFLNGEDESEGAFFCKYKLDKKRGYTYIGKIKLEQDDE